MPTEQVLFTIPPEIQTGLMSGQYERVGGVVRQSETKQVVAWLREGASAQPQDVNNILRGVTISQALSVVSTASLMMNLSLTAITFAEIKKVSSKITDLADTLQIEQDDQKQDKFNTAINAFDDMLNAQNQQTQHDRSMIAIERFEELIQEFSRNFYGVIEESVDKASYYLQQAMLASSYRARAYIQIDEKDLAKSYIAKDVVTFKEATNKLVNMLIGEKSAIFFHKDVESSDLQRYLDIMEGINQKSLHDIIMDVRHDFWNTKIVHEPFHRRLPKISKSRNFKEEIPVLLDQIEIAIENYNRLESIDMEIRYLRLTKQTYHEWNSKVNQADLDEHKVAILHLSKPVALESA